jgi:SRSO17 transposase
LYRPLEWANDADRRAQAALLEEIVLQTKPQIALDQLRAACAAGIAADMVLADAGHGNDTDFRDGITETGLAYAANTSRGA